MSFEARTAEIRALFETGWAARTVVAWPDTEFTPPDGAAWVRFDLKHNNGFQASIGAPGSNKFRREGIVTVQIFTPIGDASKTARQYADLIVAIFQGIETTTGLRFYNVFPREVGDDQHGWYQINVLASFRYDETA